MQSSHKTTRVKQAQRTLLCVYSTIYFFPPLLIANISNSKIFPKLSVAHEKKEEETFYGEIVLRDGVRGEKSHHSFHLPQFLPHIWWFSDFSGWGLSKFLSRARKNDAEAQPKSLKLKVAQPVLVLHEQLARKNTQSPVEDLAECQCQLVSWEELRPLCQTRTT